jgi:DNA-binding CsgD family transcriptional regulator
MSSVNEGHEGWLDYEERLLRVHPHFLGNLARKHPNLRITERRLCAMTLLDLNVKDIAHASGISPQGAYSARSKIWSKLGLKGIDHLLPYLHSLTAEEMKE